MSLRRLVNLDRRTLDRDRYGIRVQPSNTPPGYSVTGLVWRCVHALLEVCEPIELAKGQSLHIKMFRMMSSVATDDPSTIYKDSYRAVSDHYLKLHTNPMWVEPDRPVSYYYEKDKDELVPIHIDEMLYLMFLAPEGVPIIMILPSNYFKRRQELKDST